MKLLGGNDFTEILEGNAGKSNTISMGNGIDRSDGVRIAPESSIYNRLVFYVLNFSIQFFCEITASDQLSQMTG